ncbi:c6 zinc finger domain containing protein [Niveomyces insectorum RCEF 264]|uniref:C6 zinc finger domain containing protein n=1 Tax=Niveomyces insectorum RCEF 264 TaxID=1081102 RepID=A0A167VHR8_9HYPO|nr:c6 zinc finger domain containing protein [Niveomyces insectorum RCEF 264]
MSTPSAMARTAPIPIAPKPSSSSSSSADAVGRATRFSAIRRSHPPSRQNSINIDSYPASLAGLDSPDSDSPLNNYATIPCEACQRRRIRCIMSDDDDVGACISCQVNSIECSLSGSPQPRKRKLGGDLDDNGSKRGSSGRYDNRRRRQHGSLSSTAVSNSLIEDMANFGDVTMLKRTLGLQQDRYSQYIGPTTDFEPSLINLSPFDPHDESLLARGTLRKVSDNDTFLLLPDNNTPGYEHVADDLDEIERIVAPHGRRLIDLYFRVVHPGFPIIQKTVFYEKYEHSLREVSPPLLATIYILAINWWDLDEELSGAPRPNVRELERLVRTTLADSMFRPKLATVQAGLLLSQRPEGDQWAPTAQLVAIGQELGLHLDCSAWKIPPWERGLRKRLAWALYLQDKWGALVHGRPSHIFANNWAVTQLQPNDFQDVEWDEDDTEERIEIERGRTLFVQMVQLTQVLAEILDTFYTLQAMQTVAAAGPQGTQLVLTLAKPIQLKLKEWYSALPAAVRMDSSYATSSTTSSSSAGIASSVGGPVTSVNGIRLSSIGYLHLAYFAAEITLHRRIIRSMTTAVPVVVDSAASTPQPASSPTMPSSAMGGGGGGGGPEPYVQHICRSAAKARLISAMDFVNRLTPSHLRAFWYFASKTNFALIGTFGSLLWATSPGREEAEWYRRRLGEYRWTLSVSSKPGEGKGLTEFAMGMLDISTGLLKTLPEKPSFSRSASAVDMDAARRQSILALGVGTGGLADLGGSSSSGIGIGIGGGGRFGHSGFGSGGGMGSGGGGYSGIPSADASGAQSPKSSDDSSDDGMYGNFRPSSGMTNIAE